MPAPTVTRATRAGQRTAKTAGKMVGKRTAKQSGLRVVGKSEQAERADDTLKLEEYSDTYLECREMRHAWKLLGWYSNGALLIQHAQCQRCPTTRVKRYRRNGWMESTRYDYPEDYHLSGGVQTASVRAEMIRRAVVWTNEEEMLEGAKGSGRRQGKRNGR